ncbi:MAG: hypothetical protein FJ148_09400 [Deltaproteobacteria bacterium]|nr:hypothetical protein [Deltaproteobacteria bacterium]
MRSCWRVRRDSVAAAVLLVSDDLGESWQALADTGLAPTALAVDFADAEHGVAVGWVAAQRTFDGGRTWITQLDDPRRPPAAFVSLAAVQVDARGDASVVGNVVYPRQDGASGYESWRLPADGSAPIRGEVSGQPLAAIRSMCLTSRGAGVAVGSYVREKLLATYGTTLGSSDGGASWNLLEDVTAGSVTWAGAACAGESDLWRVGTGSTGVGQLPVLFGPAVTHSEDGGATWSGPANVADLGLTGTTAAAFADRRTGWLCGADARGPVIVHTTDAGASFARQTLPEAYSASCSRLAFADDRIGIVGGSALDRQSGLKVPYLAFTTDGGATWRAASLPDGLEEIRDVDAVR